MEISAKYIGRRTYEVKVGNHTELYFEPFFRSPEKYTKRIICLEEIFNIIDIYVTDLDLFMALTEAAKKAKRYFPNCLTY